MKTFVANRVIEIGELTQGFSWKHVPTDHNPADLASRGVDPQYLQVESLWWEGPSFWKEGSSAWPKQPNKSSELPELKVYMQTECNNEQSHNPVINFDRFSKFAPLHTHCAFWICKGKKAG